MPKNIKSVLNSSFNSRPRFDGGGYVDYSAAYGGEGQDYSNDIAPVDTTWANNYGGSNANSGAPSASDMNDAMGAYKGLTEDAADTSKDDLTSGLTKDINPGALSVAGDGKSSSAGSAAGGALSAALKALGLGGGNNSNKALLSAVTGLLSAYGAAKNNQAKGTLPTLPVLPGSTSAAGYGPTGGYGYKNYANANAATPGTGYAPVTPTAAQPTASYYTYGQGPQQQQFQQVNGGSPITPIAAANGGHVARYDNGGPVSIAQATDTINPTGASAGLTSQNTWSDIGPGGQTKVGMQMPARPQVPQNIQPMQAPNTGMARPQLQMGPQNTQQQVPSRPMPPMAPQAPQAPQPQPVSYMAQRMASARGGMQPRPGMQPQINQQNPQPMQHMAKGGDVGGALNAAMSPGVSRHIVGPGDGTSDSIPARLANGEYVIDAQAVSMLGNGDNSAGAKKLDAFRKNLRQHKGGALSKGRMAPNAKPVHKYMGGQ